MIDPSIRELVRHRAGWRCEYCGIPQEEEPFLRYQIEHIVACQHGGSDEHGNLAFACPYCNLHKGPNLAGIDPIGGELTRLFNPRVDRWTDHFEIADGWITGRTSVGRTTVRVLAINDQIRVELRAQIRGVWNE